VTTDNCSVKTSRFNLYYEQGVTTIIFNTATGKWLRLPQSIAKDLAHGETTMPDVLFKQALGAGLVVSEELDENLWLESEYQRLLHDYTQASYICVLTYRCNLRCPYCFEHAPNPEVCCTDSEWWKDLAVAIERRSEEQRTRRLAVTLFGGEPLLEAKACLSLVERLHSWCDKRRGMEFEGRMSTNGVLITPEMACAFAPHLKSVQVTFDGPRSVHDTIRIGPRTPRTFDTIVRAIHILRNAGIHVHVRAQVGATYYDRIPELVAELGEEAVLEGPGVSISLGVVHKLSKWSRCDYNDNYAPAGSEVDRRMSLSESQLPNQSLPARQILPCVMAFNGFCITPDRQLFKCIASIKVPNASVGRLSADGRFRLNAQYEKYIARNPNQMQCAKCSYVPLCGGGCPTGAWERWGTYAHANCANNRSILDQRILCAITNNGNS
jgi:uncharacterized protein